MQQDGIPEWSQPASESLGLLYQPFQPIEVYVEDSNSEAFYLELLNRMLTNGQSIHKVIPLHGKDHVLKTCADFDDDAPALFLIDGDLDLFLGQREKGYKNLFQLRAYCIENYLFCINAARELIVEGLGTVKRDQAMPTTEWNSFFDPIHPELKNLFIHFAAARKVHPELKTVKRGLQAVVTQRRKKKSPEIDLVKISDLKNEIAEECIEVAGLAAWQSALEEITASSTGLEAVDAISGKHFLLPLLEFFIRDRVNGSMTTESLMFKLAKYCSISRLDELRHALNEVLAGREFISH
ncbi:DUF4435 domain-containing protein [uncultured Pseudomonas sp.]|uniref:DUF4435 domain-containing protein n=1 Tax=uncultured Pseudomonas sp. TaxID=114707 RepID=UPI00258E57F3|nr:DUF4435 domain-containing protein [uncultured Pseudomonas sp.]